MRHPHFQRVHVDRATVRPCPGLGSRGVAPGGPQILSRGRGLWAAGPARACRLVPLWARAVDRRAAGGGCRLALAVPGGQPGWADPLPRPDEMWRVRRHATPGPAPRARTFLLSFSSRPLPLRSESLGSGCEHRRHFLCSLPASRRRRRRRPGAAEPVKQQAALADSELTSLCRALPSLRHCRLERETLHCPGTRGGTYDGSARS